ncbi:MAG: ribonuclease III [Mesorhizobium sp.]
MALKRPTGEALASIVAERTGHIFADLQLLQTALTHSSAPGAADNNERLEFLGDRVLSLIISDMLLSAFPAAREGELAVRLNALVRGETCAEVAHELGLAEMLRADAAVRSGKAKARNVMADAIEALIAAIYLDGGMDAACRFVLKYWEPRSRAIHELPRDAKTELQEWAVQAAGARPAYSIEKREGPDHAPKFTVLLELPGFEPVRAVGGSKQAAERAAAQAFLARQNAQGEGAK